MIDDEIIEKFIWIDVELKYTTNEINHNLKLRSH